MAVSVLEIFKVGIGPSSSHTVGPMRAARMFTLALAEQGVMTSVTRVLSEMFGSLGATGKGHGTDSAVLLGLSGHEPDTVDVDQVPAILEGIRGSSSLLLQGAHRIAIFLRPAMTATGSRIAPHSNHHRPPRRRRRPRTYPQREREAHEPGWVKIRWKWWVSFAWKSTVLTSRAKSMPLIFRPEI